MLSKNHRFHGLGSLRYVFKSGKTVRSQNMALRYAENNRRKEYRCSVVVSKKVEKSAVTRNRIRRRVYAALRQIGPKINKPYDLVISVYSSAVADVPPAELELAINELFAKARITD